MSFCILDKEKYPIAKEHYLKEKHFYPLISAVLNRSQDGVVFANHEDQPTTFYVEHQFGFSQIFGIRDISFFKGLRKYLLIDQAFHPQKIRLYSPKYENFLQGDAEISERCQFRLKDESNLFPEPCQYNISIENVTYKNAKEIDSAVKLDLFSRFWKNKVDFLEHGMAKVLKYDGKYASICYASAVADNIAEIDIATLPKYRQRGFGKIVCSAFIRACLDNGIKPNWDCFTNNTGSMRLAHSLGFVKFGKPYVFYTLNKTHKG